MTVKKDCPPRLWVHSSLSDTLEAYTEEQVAGMAEPEKALVSYVREEGPVEIQGPLSGKWGYSRDEEHYHGDFDTKEEAIEEGKSCERGDFTVGQYRDPNLEVDADRVLDQILEEAYDEGGDCVEGWLSRVPRKQLEALSLTLSAAFQKWLVEHKHLPSFGIIDQHTLEKIENIGENHEN